MTIAELCKQLGDIAAENPRGMDAEVVIWLRSRKAIEHLSILNISHTEVGYRQSLGGSIACICASLDVPLDPPTALPNNNV